MTVAGRKAHEDRVDNRDAEVERLRGELTRRKRDAKRLQRKNDRLQSENDRLKQQIEGLKRQLAEAGRAGRAGEKTFIDFSGKRPTLVDRRTGELRPVELFVAVLGASSLTYAEASRPSERLPASRSACATQFRIASADGSNSRASSPGGHVPRRRLFDEAGEQFRGDADPPRCPGRELFAGNGSRAPSPSARPLAGY